MNSEKDMPCHSVCKGPLIFHFLHTSSVSVYNTAPRVNLNVIIDVKKNLNINDLTTTLFVW